MSHNSSNERVLLLWEGGMITHDTAVPLGLANFAVMGSEHFH